MQNIVDKIIQWHKDRNLLEGSTDKDQVLKLLRELGELSDHVCKDSHQMLIADDLGDMMVVMINISRPSARPSPPGFLLRPRPGAR